VRVCIDGATENASTENESTGGWNMQVRKSQVRICKGGKRKYTNLKSILKSLRFSSLAFSVDPQSVGLDQITCTVGPYQTGVIHKKSDSCWTHAQKGLGSKIAGATLSSNSLRQTVYTHCTLVHQAAKLVAALLRVARVGLTAGLAESNGSLPPGL